MSPALTLDRSASTDEDQTSFSEQPTRHRKWITQKEALFFAGLHDFQDNATFAWRSVNYPEVTTAAVGYCTSKRRIVTSLADASKIAFAALERAERKLAEAALREAQFYERLGE